MNLGTWQGYYNRFLKYVGTGYNHITAFHLTQIDFEKEYGKLEHKGYKSYQSFKNKITKESKNRK